MLHLTKKGTSEVTGSRRQLLKFYIRIGVGIVLTCALLVRVGLVGPLRVASSQTTFRSDRFPLKTRLLDPRSTDLTVPAQEFAALDPPGHVPLISHSFIGITTHHPRGPDSIRPPPQI